MMSLRRLLNVRLGILVILSTLLYKPSSLTGREMKRRIKSRKTQKSIKSIGEDVVHSTNSTISLFTFVDLLHAINNSSTLQAEASLLITRPAGIAGLLC